MTAPRAPVVAARLKQALTDGAGALRNTSPTPRLDAEVLLAHALQCPRSHLYTWPDARIPPRESATFDTLIDKRRRGVPVAYLRGRQEFWGLDFEVDPRVLIPRPETEHLVEAALARLPPGGRFLELGTGSGAVALAVARERPDVTVVATERSTAALEVAKRNRRRLELERVVLLAADWTHGVAGPFDVIASNPPYVASGDPCLNALEHEPLEALAAGPDGLDAIRELLPGAVAALAPGGALLLEHGAEQGDAVATLMGEAGLQAVQGIRDLAGYLRIAAGRQ